MMMWKIDLKGDSELRVKLNNLSDKMLTKQLMTKLSLQAVTEIFENTEKGIDKTGKPFKRYSSSYLEDKRKRGGGWLFDKGQMMGNLTAKTISRSKAFLHFPKTKERLKASGHIKGSRILPQRDFFGLTKDGEKVLIRIVDNNLKDLTDG
jgi:phage gpG-like protein